jgi:UDP:flavonoid glycosyltransferase YjiC (YdhE family)
LERPFDLQHAARTCDLAIANGNHGTTAALLLAGKPVLVIPTVAEQYMLGQRVEAMGTGVLARPDDSDDMIGGLLRILRCDEYRIAAGRFRDRYRSTNPAQVAAAIVESIERVLR